MTDHSLQFIKSAIANNKKLLAVLVDPDKTNQQHCAQLARAKGVDLFLVGGSLLSKNNTRQTINFLKEYCNTPVLIFPGNAMQVEDNADALLFLSLISGRNPDMLIGQHVAIATQLKNMDLEVIPTGYMLIDSGKPTAALYMSQTLPIPSDKPEIASATAIAGELLGLKMIYMDAGSGARQPVPAEIIRQVKNELLPDTPLFVGGGIDSVEKARLAFQSGADVVVVGNKLEKDPEFILKLTESLPDLSNV